MSVAEGDRRRQEFSFTLYDLDGHGKITKDDIAGLVTTIYDTLGNSIQVPPCGSKTIKVKLTVTPDQRAGSQSPSPPQPPPPAPSAPAASTSRKTCLNATSTPKTLPISSCCHLKHNVAPCGHAAALYAGRSANRIPRRRRAPRQYRCQVRPTFLGARPAHVPSLRTHRRRPSSTYLRGMHATRRLVS